MSARPNPASPHRSWRARPESGPHARHVNRVLLTLLGLILLALLAWLLWWWIFLPGVHLLCLPVVDYDYGRVVPIRFCAEDVAALTEALPRASAAVLEDLQTSDSITTLANRLSGQIKGQRDVLIFYLSGHGLSDDGQAWLLCSDFLRRDDARDRLSGRIRAADLLRQLQPCPARVKLLILDAGQLGADPRLGMIANEFPRLLADEVRGIEEPGLWVLLANRPLETSHVSCSARRTAFGWFVAEGLRGTADKDADGMVELAELFDFVRRGVAGWVDRQSDGQQRQTPWLLRGGVGPADAPEGLALLPVSDRPQGPASAAATGHSGASDEEHTRPAVGPPEAGLRDLLLKAWQLCDRMQDRDASGPWSPVDYAPHLWSEFQELLLGYELRCRAGAAFDADRLAKDLQANVLPLQDWMDGGGGGLPSTVGRSPVLARLAEARRRFLASGDQSGDVDEALRCKNDLLYRARYYVRWHGLAQRASPRQHRLLRPVSDLLSELRSFLDRLERLEVLASDGGPAARITEIREQLAVGRQRLEDLRKAIERDGLYRNAADLAERARKHPKTKGIAGAMDALLAVPLLPADLRMRVLAARAGLDQPLSSADAPPASLPRPPSIVPWSRRLRDQAGLENALVRLADPAASLTPPVASAAAEQPQAAERLWAEYRQLGRQLRSFYQELPAAIDARRRSADPPTVRSAERLLRLVDARDARRVARNAPSLAVRPIRLPATVEPRLALTGPKTLAPGPEGATPFEITGVAEGGSANTAQVQLTYDPSLLTVEHHHGAPAVGPGQWADVAVSENRVTLRYRALPKVHNAAACSLVVTLRCGELSATHRITVELPAPDVVDLVVDGVRGTAVPRPDGAEGIRLRPFPNRVTGYRFRLLNRSGRARKVTVELLALPESVPLQAPSRDLVLDASGNPIPGIRQLAPPLTVNLPADPTPQPIPFPPPQPPETDAETPTAAGEEKPPPGPQVTRGLACLIRESAAGPPRWIKWIEFSPRPPRDYLKPRVDYDAGRGRISIEVKAASPQDLPPLSSENPIRVVWDTEGALPANATVKDAAELADADAMGRLYADVEADPDRRVRVRLSVDGYPRAFVYEVQCDRDRQDIPRERSLREVAMTGPDPNHAYRIPLQEPMVVSFRVDAPEDAFLRPGDVVEVGIDEDGDRELRREPSRRFFNDRQAEIRLRRLAPQGTVEIRASVGDFRVTLSPTLKNAEVALLARLVLGRRLAARDALPVVLDGGKPVFRISAPGRPVAQGTPLGVTAEVEQEVSGVQRMEFGLHVERAGNLQPIGQPKVLEEAAVRTLWTTSLPTQEIEPGRYVLLARATDRAGNSSIQQRLVTIGPPAAPAPAKTTSAIEGRVLLANNGQPLAGIRISLQGTRYSAVTDRNGRFTFRDVPHGKYTLEAAGTVITRQRRTEKEIVLPQASEPAVVEIRMEW